ncbi:MAG: response regulator transcription factor [Devosia sp.]|uniref:response regulator n=1 Tax=Devosia sp. TaxID=1871048 RepID=UPI002620530A|nr:response regulator [Devosia sp.]MDB5529695.1 response regulator transcription factor [Devosia sp.]
MNTVVDNTPYYALVDDDAHSAHLLTRMLLAHGAPRIVTFANATDAIARLFPSLATPATWPSLVIIDLKAHSAANLEFVALLAPVIGNDIPVVVMAQRPDRQHIADLHDAGADAVFTRHAERDAYRREAANIVSFWARSQRLDAVGM